MVPRFIQHLHSCRHLWRCSIEIVALSSFALVCSTASTRCFDCLVTRISRFVRRRSSSESGEIDCLNLRRLWGCSKWRIWPITPEAQLPMPMASPRKLIEDFVRVICCTVSRSTISISCVINFVGCCIVYQ